MAKNYKNDNMRNIQMKKIIDFKAVLTDISRTYEFVYLLISAKE